MVDEMTMEDARYLTRPSRWSGISRASPPMPNYGNMPAKSTRRVGPSVSLATRMPPIPPRPPEPKVTSASIFKDSDMKKISALLALACATATGQAQAHHAFNMYDNSVYTKFTGTVKSYSWRNPHVMIEYVAQTPKGPAGLDDRMLQSEHHRPPGLDADLHQAGRQDRLHRASDENGTAYALAVTATLPNGAVLKDKDCPEPISGAAAFGPLALQRTGRNPMDMTRQPSPVTGEGPTRLPHAGVGRWSAATFWAMRPTATIPTCCSAPFSAPRIALRSIVWRNGCAKRA
jgi:hypothetical protein